VIGLVVVARRHLALSGVILAASGVQIAETYLALR